MEKQWRTAVKMAVNAALAADKRAIDKDWTHSYLSRNSPSMGRDFCIARYRVEKRCFFAIEERRAGPADRSRGARALRSRRPVRVAGVTSAGFNMPSALL
jgi:hypothetical protein